jgi:AraC-type DNA-binding domain-containing proteins
LYVGDGCPICLEPHTLIIIPAGQPFRIEVATDQVPASFRTVRADHQVGFAQGTLLKLIAGEGEPRMMTLCGHFRATYGASISLFATLHAPMIEHLDALNEIELKLKVALAELKTRQVGIEAMTTALMKQVLVILLRRSLSSVELWVQRLSMLADPQIARAYSEMAARPGAQHSVQKLSQVANLSRSAFMARFQTAFGTSPMALLRNLRMNQATTLLATDDLTIDQIARRVGYASRGSFLRAYRTYGQSSIDHDDAMAPWV